MSASSIRNIPAYRNKVKALTNKLTEDSKDPEKFREIVRRFCTDPAFTAPYSRRLSANYDVVEAHKILQRRSEEELEHTILTVIDRALTTSTAVGHHITTSYDFIHWYVLDNDPEWLKQISALTELIK